MLKKILIAVVVLFAGFAAFVATRPDAFHIERAATVNAPADVVYAQVADFHGWAGWSPWDKLDPGMKRTFSGPESGVGASYSWTGNDKVGEGTQTITAAEPNQKIVIRLEFKKPWEATNQVTFRFQPEGENTKVTWSMDGTNNFMGKAFGVFMDMDKLVGADFEKGLAALGSSAKSADDKRRAEEAAKAAAAPPAEANAAPAPDAKPAEPEAPKDPKTVGEK